MILTMMVNLIASRQSRHRIRVFDVLRCPARSRHTFQKKGIDKRISFVIIADGVAEDWVRCGPAAFIVP